MSEDVRPSLEIIVWAPAPKWKLRHRTVLMEFLTGIPACIGLGAAVNFWRTRAEISAITAVALGFLLTSIGVVLLAQWNKQEATWKRREMLSRAKSYGYSEEDVVAYEDRWEREAESSE